MSNVSSQPRYTTQMDKQTLNELNCEDVVSFQVNYVLSKKKKCHWGVEMRTREHVNSQIYFHIKFQWYHRFFERLPWLMRVFFFNFPGISILNAIKILSISYISKVRAIQNYPTNRKSTFYYFFIKIHQKWWIKVTFFFPKVILFLIGEDY